VLPLLPCGANHTNSSCVQHHRRRPSHFQAIERTSPSPLPPSSTASYSHCAGGCLVVVQRGKQREKGKRRASQEHPTLIVLAVREERGPAAAADRVRVPPAFRQGQGHVPGTHPGGHGRGRQREAVSARQGGAAGQAAAASGDEAAARWDAVGHVRLCSCLRHMHCKPSRECPLSLPSRLPLRAAASVRKYMQGASTQP
jgi:hypothetical protein